MNTHIKDFLTYYIESKFAPEYAVLIDGEWGSGKTFFVKNYLQNTQWKFWEETKLINISLFGLSSTEQIDEQIYQHLHPILSSKPIKFGATILKGAARLGLKVDLDEDGKPDGTININFNEFLPDKDIGDKSSKKQIVFIFDDLERTNINIKTLLGYINTLIEQLKFKVIIIADQNNITNNEEEKSKKTEYNKFKEKMIGKTFKVTYDFESSLKEFTKLATNSKTILRENSSNIKRIFETARYYNLRHLRQTIIEFDLLFVRIDEKYTTNTELIKEVIELFFIISIEIKKDNSKIKTIFSYDDESILRKKYDLNLFNLILSLDLLKDIFEGKKIENSLLNENLSVSKYYRDENKEDWIKLWHYIELDDESFETVIKNSIEKLNNKTYTDIYIIIHIIGILFTLSKTGLYTKSQKEILRYSKEIVKKNVESYKNINFELDISFGQHNLGFYGKEIEEFKELIKFIEKRIEKSKIKYVKNEVKTILGLIQKNETIKVIDILKHNYDLQYEPFFKYVDVEEFYELLINIPNKDLFELLLSLKRRYEHMQDTYKEEELFWLKYKDTIVSKTKDIEKTIRTHLLINFIKYIDEIINKIEKIKKREEFISECE